MSAPGSDPEPIVGTCRTCRGEFEISELSTRRDGSCPRCGEQLAPEWTTLLIEEVEKLQTLHDALIRCLRRLAALPGNLELTPRPFWRNILDQVPWTDRLSTQPQQIAAEIARTREQLETWARAIGTDEEQTEVDEAVRHLHRLAGRMRTLALLLDIQQDLTGHAGAAGAPARASAEDLDRRADQLVSGHSSPEELASSIDLAESTAEAAQPFNP